MKKKSILPLLFLCLFSTFCLAQAPLGIPYQAVARNAQGVLIDSQAVKVRFSIMDSIATGSIVFVETHTVTTNSLGLFSLNIGQGSPGLGTLGGVNWAINFKFLKVEIDPTGTGTSYVDVGTQQMMSVPYSLYSAKSGQLIGGSGSDPNTLIFTTDGF